MPTPFRVHSVRQSGRTYKIPEYGNGPNVVVLRHGYGVGVERYAHSALALADLGATVFVVPTPGLGNAPSLGYAVTLDDLTDWAHGIYQKLGIPRWAVHLGHSFGGGLVLDYTLKYAHNVGGVALIAPNNTPSPLTQGIAMGMTLWRMALTQPYEAWSFAMDFTLKAAIDPAGSTNLIRVASQINTSAADIHIAQNGVPAVLIRGTDDEIVTDAGARGQGERLNCIYHVVKGGHEIGTDMTDDVLGIVSSFAATTCAATHWSERQSATLDDVAPLIEASVANGESLVLALGLA